MIDRKIMKAFKKLMFGIILLTFMFSLCSCGNSIAEDSGTIKVEVVDIEGKSIKEKSIIFEQGNTLVELVEANFENVTIENGMLLSIESLTTPADWSTYICIYVDGQMSMKGIMDIKLVDGMTVKFADTKL